MTEPRDPEPQRTERSADEPSGQEVRTILIADIRGYTSYTREHGDDAAAALASRFADVVRSAVEARSGRLVELRGDEALAVFTSSRQALRAALDIQSRVAEAGLPRGVGIGLDAGEAVPVGDGYRGTALNLAARLCAQAQAGEVLATEAVVHLAATVEGVGYVSPRVLRLKGFNQPVRAVRVVRPEAVVAGRSVRRLIPAGREAPRRLLIAAGVAGAVLTAVVLFILGSSRQGAESPTDSPTSASSGAVASPAAEEVAAPPFDGPGVAFLDPETGEPIGERIPFRNPVEVEYVDGAFWVLDIEPRALHRIDPETRAITASMSLGFDVGTWLVDGNTIWITDYEQPIVYRFDALSGREVTRFELDVEPTGLGGIAISSGSLWVALRDQTEGVARVDAATGEVLERYPVFASHVVASDEVVWAAGFDLAQVHRIDPRTDQVATTVELTSPISNIVLVGAAVWATNPTNGEVYQLTDRGTLANTYSVPGAWYLGLGDGRMWAAGEEERTVDRIDLLTGDQVTFEASRSVNDVAEGEGLVALAMPRQADDVLVGLTGDVLRIGTSFHPFEYIDPAIAGSFANGFRDQVEQATCAKLVNYPDVAPPEGWELQPEVAAAMPEVSADGLTYTFTVREGYAFSPPSSEALTAETYRYSIERALSPALGPNATGIEFLSDIAGAEAFHAGDASSVSGLATDGDTLTITLTQPSPGFLHYLAMPLFCPVPVGTPAVHNGVNYPPIARSGPYYVADLLGGVVTLLKANPNYPGPRAAAFDAVVWRSGQESGSLIGEVQRGETDLTVFGAGLELGGTIHQEWGPGSEAAEQGDQRYFFTPEPLMDAVALNPIDPLLSEPAVRHAVRLALDRSAQAAVFDGIPVGSLLTSAVPGHDLTEQANVEPALGEARRLMAGRTGSVVLAACPFPGCEEWAGVVAENLGEIGITVEVRVVDDPIAEAGDPDAGIGIVNAFAACGCVVPDPALAVDTLVESMPDGWLPAPIVDEAAELFSLDEPERSERAAALADRLAVEDSYLIPFATYGAPHFFSERIGCQIPMANAPGFNLVALCLRQE